MISSVNFGYNQAALQRLISEGFQIEFIGNQELAFANAALLKALGNPWVSDKCVRESATFTTEVGAGEKCPPVHSEAKSIEWEFKASGNFVLRVTPTVPRDLAVIVPVFNPDMTELEACVKSIVHALAFSKAEDFAVILLDDGSHRNGNLIEPLVKRLREEHSLGDDQLRLLSSAANRGVAKTRNRGFGESKQNFVYFIDADDLVHPWYFSLLHAELEKGADLVSSSMMYSSGKIFCADNKPINEILLRNANGSGIGVRRAFFSAFPNRSAPYNEVQSFHNEDWELNIFMRLAGAKVAVIDAPLYYYRMDRFGRHSTNEHFKAYSVFTTPFNALKSASAAGLEFEGKDLYAYVEKLMDDLLARPYFQVPGRPTSRLTLLYRAFLNVDEAISKKMYMLNVLKFIRRVWRSIRHD